MISSYESEDNRPSLAFLLCDFKKFIKKMIVKLKKGNNHQKVIITRKPEAVCDTRIGKISWI